MPHHRQAILLCTALLIALLVRPGIASAAQLGRGFTYQGQLSQSGVPVDGTVTMRFSLWNDPGSGDPPVGGIMVGAIQAVANITVTGGIFSVVLNGSDQFGSQAFNGEARWLQVEVCGDTTCSTTTVLGPRQAVTGAPYALGPWQMSGTSINYVGGKVGIGTTSPAFSLHIKDLAPAVALQDTASASQQAGYISFRNNVGTETGWMGYGSAGSPDMTLANARTNGDIAFWAAGEKMRVVNSTGNVGIGTAVPASRLEVRGDIRLGPVGEYQATAGSEVLRVLRARVSSTGVVLSGTGITATRQSTGVYLLGYSPTFPTLAPAPTVTVTPSTTSVASFAIVSGESFSGVFVRIMNTSGTLIDETFNVIVAGAR